MRKEAGKYLIECYDDLGHKETTLEGCSFEQSNRLGDKWLEDNPEGSTVIMLVMSNSKMKGDKWTWRKKND